MKGQAAYSGEENHPWVRGFLEHCLGSELELCELGISARDEMFAYAIDENLHHRGHALVAYFRGGLLASQIVEQVVANRPDREPESILDFGSGHGRSTRFLCRFMDPSCIHVCDVGEGTNEFQARTFGVNVVEPSLRPKGFRPGRRFDVVFAFSFFTHMPKERFREWLHALWASVAEGGTFVFSTFGPRAMLPGRRFDPDGFFYEGVSESERLDVDEYGSAWIEEPLLREWIAGLADAGDPVYQEQALWSYQDLWIVPRGTTASPVAIEPLGFLDGARPRSPFEVELNGWAFDRSSSPGPVAIEVRVNGDSCCTATTDQFRPDVAEVLSSAYGTPATFRAGWATTLELNRPIRPSDFLLIEARPSSGRSTTIHASSLEGASLLRSASESKSRARLDLQEMEMTIRALQQSRFWKLHSRWLALKRSFFS